MSKRSSKFKDKEKQSKAKSEEMIVMPCDAFREALKGAFLEAMKEYDIQKKQVAKQPKQEERGKQNRLLQILTMPFISREKVKGTMGLRVLVSLVLYTLFSLLRVIAFALVIGAGMVIVQTIIEDGVSIGMVGKTLCLIATAVLSYLFAGLFRRISFEVENLSDENMLLSLFAAMGTWISLVIAAIAVYKK